MKKKEHEVSSKSQSEIMRNWKDPVDNPLVTIRVLVYNHEKYIHKCLDGLLMQETDFPFEILIHDDASQDKSAEIIREYEVEYSQIIKPIYETENQYSKGNGQIEMVMNARIKGKYVALCEGDDFWTDPLKLQKQIDLFRGQPDLTLVYTGFDCCDDSGNPIVRSDRQRLMGMSFSGDIFLALLQRNFVMTLTTCYRRDVWLNPYVLNAPVSQDYLLSLIASALGDVAYIKDRTACYRQASNSLMNTQLKKVVLRNFKIFNYVAGLYKKGLLPQRTGLAQKEILSIIRKRTWKIRRSRLMFFLSGIKHKLLK